MQSLEGLMVAGVSASKGAHHVFGGLVLVVHQRPQFFAICIPPDSFLVSS